MFAQVVLQSSLCTILRWRMGRGSATAEPASVPEISVGLAPLISPLLRNTREQQEE